MSEIPYFVRYKDVTTLDSTDSIYLDDATSDVPKKISYSDFTSSISTSIATGNIIFVTTKSDLPTAVSGVITLAANKTYFFTTTVDLTGDRLVCGANATILGGSSENCVIKSTGLSSSTALITSVYSLPIRNITITHGTALNLNGDGVTTALDWAGVNFTNCQNVGTIKNYSNVIWIDSAFLNSGGLIFDGTIGTIGFISCLFDNYSASTAISILSTCTISRRFRMVYSSFITLSGETSINMNSSVTISDERYILDNVNFGGGGTYLSGLDYTSNKTLLKENVGITNTAVNGQLYMQGNTTTTTVTATNTFYKILGTTTASADNSKYTHSNNRLTNGASISRKYLIQCSLSFTAGSGDVCQFGFYDSKLGAVRTPSKTKATANASGRAENIFMSCVVSHSTGDYLEIHCANLSSTTNILVSDLNFVITEIK